MSFYIALSLLALSFYHLFHLASYKGALFLAVLSVGTLIYYFGRELLKRRV